MLPSSSDTINSTSCNPIDTGVFVQFFTNQYSCDSIITNIVSLLPSTNTIINATSCNPLDTGISVQYLTNVYGCDSLITTHTTLLPSIIDINTGFQTECDEVTNTYTQEIILTYYNAPSGNVIVNGQSFTISSSPQTLILTGLLANGLPVNITASFSAINTCPKTENALFFAPQNCFTESYTITYIVNPVSAGNIVIDGVNTTSFPTTITYLSGTNVSIDANENTNFIFDFWESDNSIILPNITNDNANFVVIADDTIVASFEELEYDSLWVITNPAGVASLEVGNDIITGSPYLGIYPLNQILNINAIPSGANVFNQWNLSGTSTPDYSASTFFSFTGQDTLFAYFNNVLAVENIGEDINEIKVYPTSINNELNIEVEVNNSTNLKVELISISGKRIKTLFDKQLNSSFKETYDLDISQGIYFVNFISNESFVSYKIIKVR